MNQTYQLFLDLEALVKANEAFYRQEFKLDGKIYWIYNYRLASYSDFLLPSALECRGAMVEVDDGGNFIRLACRPQHKFFNLGENPSTMALDLSRVTSIELKADGSLMSSYVHNDVEIRLKSKGSLFSEQACDANIWLQRPENKKLYGVIQSMESEGYTTNLEWCAPHNRIVIGYAQPHLKVLNVRNRDTGRYVSREMLESWFGEYLIPAVDTNGLDTAAFVAGIPAMLDDIEGYIVRIGNTAFAYNDTWVKIKTNKYVSLHHSKDSINNPRRLFEAILDEGIDDLRSMFSTDAAAITLIDQMQEKVNYIHNELVATVEAFYEANKQLIRKDFAIKAKAELPHMHFGLVMLKYVGKDFSYKEVLKSKYKELGIRDSQQDAQNDLE